MKEINSKEFARNNGKKISSIYSYRENEAVNIKYLVDFRTRLVKEGRYFKYLRRDYKPDYDASCVKEKSLLYKKVKVLLVKKIKIKENIVEKD